jgi:hypothetical protein
MTGPARRGGENDGQHNQHDVSNIAHHGTPWKSQAKPAGYAADQ